MSNGTHNRSHGGGQGEHPPSHLPPSHLPPIRFADLARALLMLADTLLPQWLPGGARRGHEWVCGSLAGEAGSSCQVNLTTGQWADFAGDERGGDLLSLYAAINGQGMAQAARDLAAQLGLEDVAGIVHTRAAGGAAPGHAPPPRREPPPAAAKPAAPSDKESWRTLMPVPPQAPAPTFRHQYRQASDIVHTARYECDGHTLGYVVRFRTSDGGKETLPYTYCVGDRDGGMRWHWRQFDEPRPLYLPGGKLPTPEARSFVTVVVVEGEVKAQVLQTLLDAVAPGVYLVASWPGGSKAWHKALWGWLAGCTVLLWPDCDAKREPLTRAEKDATQRPGADGQPPIVDEAARLVLQQAKPYLPEHKQPGMAAMLGIGHLLQSEHACTVQLLPIPKPGEVPDGWDARDAIEVDGWDGPRVLAFFGQAQPLPSPEPDETAGATSGQTSGPGGASAGGAGKASTGSDGAAGGPSGGGAGHSGGGGRGGKNGAASAGAGDGGGGGDGGGDRGGKPWWLRPYWDAEKEKWYVSRKLVIAALTHDPMLAGVLGLNLLSNNIEARRPWPWEHGDAGPVKGATDLMLAGFLSDTYGLPSIPRMALAEAIEYVGQRSPFHPVREWLAGLVWDGIPRLDKWLVFVLGESPDSLPPPLVEYLSLVGRYWLLGMVYRVQQPGCKFDYCPVLEGPGGMRKSTLIETLCGAAWFSDTHFDVARGKEGQEQVQGVWVYEIAELANFGKAEIALIKAFISAKVDRYRPSYGRAVESYPRQCVMAGSTNENTYLRDRSGNRRFWPIPVRKRINVDWVQRWREQLFAEAMALYAQGPAQAPYAPTVEQERRLFVPMQESRLVESAVQGELLRLLTRDPENGIAGQAVNNMASFVTMAQLTHALGVDAAKAPPGLESQIRAWLEHEGWVRTKRQVAKARAWGYVRPDGWLSAADASADAGEAWAVRQVLASAPSPRDGSAFSAGDGLASSPAGGAAGTSTGPTAGAAVGAAAGAAAGAAGAPGPASDAGQPPPDAGNPYNDFGGADDAPF